MTQSPLIINCHDTGEFPGNILPAVLYKNAVAVPRWFKGLHIRLLFRRHGWYNSWDSGVFTYHHYHSITHEVLGFYEGKTILQLGGENGRTIEVGKGDVLILPAGVAHKNLGDEFQIKCIGAYPEGRKYDIRTGKRGERPAADRNIAGLPIPAADPLLGEGKGMSSIWPKIEKLSAY